MNDKTTITESTTSPIIEVKNLHKSFGKLEVLKGVDLDINKGDVVAIIGPSGCGKSTFLRCLNLLEQPNAGQILLDGEYVYKNMDDLVEFLAGHLANESFSSDQVRAYMKKSLPKLNYWKRYAELGGEEKFNEFKKQLINEIINNCFNNFQNQKHFIILSF